MHRIAHRKVSFGSSALFPQAVERKNFLMLEGYVVTLSEIGAKNEKVVTIYFLYNTFKATMNLDFFSLARYTCPNLPLPIGLPISKSSIDQAKGLNSFTFLIDYEFYY